jgi:hypothetical protein
MSLNVLLAHSLIDIYAKCIHAEYIWHIQAQVHLATEVNPLMCHNWMNVWDRGH